MLVTGGGIQLAPCRTPKVSYIWSLVFPYFLLNLTGSMSKLVFVKGKISVPARIVQPRMKKQLNYARHKCQPTTTNICWFYFYCY